MLKLDHLNVAQHQEAAKLLRRVQDDLSEIGRIIHRAPATDAVLRVQKRVQETLIDPLNEALTRCSDYSIDQDHLEPLYPSVSYGVRG